MYIDDLNTRCVVHKFIDDTTLTEILLKGYESAHSRMPQYLDNLLTWSTENCMVINSKKTKEMILVLPTKVHHLFLLLLIARLKDLRLLNC